MNGHSGRTELNGTYRSTDVLERRPDGHWLAYSSDESGKSEVYVRDCPGCTRKVQISTGGGDQAMWGQRGKGSFTSPGTEA